jgi:hypothetical protein
VSSDRFTEDESILPDPELDSAELPAGIARRAFMMRSAVAGVVAVIAGPSPVSAQQAP